MATVYFTNSAAVGTGSILDAIRRAKNNDVVMPDPNVFPAGKRIDVQLTSALDLTKSLTFDGRARRVRLIAASYNCLIASDLSGSVNFAAYDFEFVGAVRKEGGTARYVRCGFYGGTYTSHLALFSGSCVGTIEDCVVAGSRSGGVRPVTSRVTIYRSTFAGNVEGDLVPNQTAYTPTCVDTIVNVTASEVGFVNPPPDSLTVPSGKTALPWDEWNLHLTPSSPYSTGLSAENAESLFDGDGNRRHADGARGAYETIDADLYWIGKDANGDDVATPSLESSDGWADDRWATTSGSVLPSSVSSLYVGEQIVAFSGTWTPTDGKIIIGRGDVSATFGSEVEATVGLGALTFSGDVIAKSPLDGFVPVAPATLTASVASAESFVVSTGVTLKVGEGQIGALSINGGNLVVTGSLNVDSLTLTSGVLNLAETNVRFDSLAINGGNLVAESLTLDSLSMSSGSITLNDDAILRATEATVSGGTISAPLHGYLAVSANTAVGATLNGVTILNPDVNGSDFRAETTFKKAILSWTADLPTTLETVSPFSLISDSATSSVSQNIASSTTFRLWNGSDWLYATASPTRFYTVESWGEKPDDVVTGDFATAWGVSPNIEH